MGTVEFLLSALRQIYLALTLRTGVHHSRIHLNVTRQHVVCSLHFTCINIQLVGRDNAQCRVLKRTRLCPFNHPNEACL